MEKHVINNATTRMIFVCKNYLVVAAFGRFPFTIVGLSLIEPFFFFDDEDFLEMPLELRRRILRSLYGIRGRLNSSGFFTL